MEAYLKALEMKRKPHLFDTGIKPIYKYAAAGLFAFWSAKYFYTYLNNAAEIKLRKERLSIPVYEVKETDLENPPWLNDYDNWKYRLVKFEGRFVHRKTAYIPRKVNGYEGFDYVVPCAIVEKDRLADQSGFIVNKGWIPHEMKQIENKWRVENAYMPEPVVGMITKNEDLNKSIFFKRGNVEDEQRFSFNNLNLKELAKMTGFSNRKAAEVAVIEAIDTEFTKLDEKNPYLYARSLGPEYDFPYKKTLAGALQPTHSDKEVKLKGMAWLAASALVLLL